MGEEGLDAPGDGLRGGPLARAEGLGHEPEQPLLLLDEVPLDIPGLVGRATVAGGDPSEGDVATDRDDPLPGLAPARTPHTGWPVDGAGSDNAFVYRDDKGERRVEKRLL